MPTATSLVQQQSCLQAYRLVQTHKTFQYACACTLPAGLARSDTARHHDALVQLVSGAVPAGLQPAQRITGEGHANAPPVLWGSVGPRPITLFRQGHGAHVGCADGRNPQVRLKPPSARSRVHHQYAVSLHSRRPPSAHVMWAGHFGQSRQPPIPSPLLPNLSTCVALQPLPTAADQQGVRGGLRDEEPQARRQAADPKGAAGALASARKIATCWWSDAHFN